MPELSILLVLVIVGALAFDYINGFHDTANAIATVVSTRVLTPLQAVMMAAVLNVAGAMVATHVAKTIAGGIVDPTQATEVVVLAAVVGAIGWNLITWVYGIPSSSSHALIGGLLGAAIAKGGVTIVTWNGVVDKVILPLVGSPIVGFFVAFLVMRLIAGFFHNVHPGKAGGAFRKLQLVSSALMAFSHGQNDAQKSMGIITMVLVMGGMIPEFKVPLWVILSCAAAITLGILSGGWRIVRTIGFGIYKIRPLHAINGQVTSASVILTASLLGGPVSTTHVTSSGLMGIGASERARAVHWSKAREILTTWVLTIPGAAVAGIVFYLVFKLGDLVFG